MIETELKPIGFLRGLAYFIFAAAFCVGFGALLTVTLVGAIVGLPLMLIGFGMALFSPFASLIVRRGRCPHCSSYCLVVEGKTVIRCSGCKKRIRVKKISIRRSDDCLAPLE